MDCIAVAFPKSDITAQVSEGMCSIYVSKLNFATKYLIYVRKQSHNLKSYRIEQYYRPEWTF